MITLKYKYNKNRSNVNKWGSDIHKYRVYNIKHIRMTVSLYKDLSTHMLIPTYCSFVSFDLNPPTYLSGFTSHFIDASAFIVNYQKAFRVGLNMKCDSCVCLQLLCSCIDKHENVLIYCGFFHKRWAKLQDVLLTYRWCDPSLSKRRYTTGEES